MKKPVNPRFIQNTPHGVDKYEGKSAERVADAIKSHIEEYSEYDNLAKIIGLDGEWGSGKSNIIRILTKKLGDNYYVFEYDAWGNQEDLQRRSFLEQLTQELIDKRILEGETKISKRNGGLETVSWNDKLQYLLAQKKETVTERYPRISNGIAAAGAVAILTPIFVFIAYALKPHIANFWSTSISIVISLTPVIVSLVVWYTACKRQKKYCDLGYLLAIYNDKIENETNFETISEHEPSVVEFKIWMNDISNFIEAKKINKLIVVFDNMDRLPADKVKQLWSSIHTFFSDTGYKNIWVIIPFDKTHLANAFGENPNGEQLELTTHFINKTFPVIYRVAPPIVTDWKKTFNEFFTDAFGESEEDEKLIIQRIFGICKEQITPRAIIAFINEIVSLKRTWIDEIPLLYLSVFVLKKDILLKAPVMNILSGSYLGKIESIVPNNEDLQRYISAITFGIEVRIAEQIPLKQYLQKTLKGEPSVDINKYADNKHFISILDDELKDFDPTFTEKAILSLAKLEPERKLKFKPQWNELVKMQLKNEISSLVFSDSHRELLLYAENRYKIEFSKYLYNGYLNYKEFNGSSFFSAMEAFENFIKANNLIISFSDLLVTKNVSPEIFIDYVRKSKSRYNDFKINCDNKKLNDYLIGLLEDGLQNMEFIGYLTNSKHYDFTALQERIELIISGNKLTISNFPELIKTYKLISKNKPLPTKLSADQVQTLIGGIKDISQSAYYDLVAMGLVTQQVNTPYSEGLDEEVAKVIEYYLPYSQLLILAKNWESDLLRRTVKAMTTESLGMNMQILDVLPFFEEITTAIDLTPASLLQELCRFENSIVNITTENIETSIPKYKFYYYSTETKNKLTEHINKIALEKLKTIPESELYAERNAVGYYWLNCAAILIERSLIESLPDNLMEFSKMVLNEIASGEQPIPSINSILDRIINNANKSRLQPTVKSICDDFCNRTTIITPSLFVYFTENFDFINKMTSRSGDITRNILNTVFSDPTCLKLILDNSSGYISKINEAGDDAEDLKSSIYEMLQNNPSDELIDFASAIGVHIEQDPNNEDVKD